MCFVCGMNNSFGLKAKFYELEDGQLMAIFQPADEHQGYPGRLHGGIAATILDETIGRAIMVKHSGNIWGVTIDFSMKLRKPVPLDGEIRVLARIVSEGNRFFLGEGEIFLPTVRLRLPEVENISKWILKKLLNLTTKVKIGRLFPCRTIPNLSSCTKNPDLSSPVRQVLPNEFLAEFFLRCLILKKCRKNIPPPTELHPS